MEGGNARSEKSVVNFNTVIAQLAMYMMALQPKFNSPIECLGHFSVTILSTTGDVTIVCVASELNFVTKTEKMVTKAKQLVALTGIVAFNRYEKWNMSTFC